MKLIYIAGPYTGKTIFDTVNNIRVAENYTIRLIQKGYAVICPHKNTALLDGAVDKKVFLEMDMEILSRCDGVLFLPCWKASRGSVSEFEFCKEKNISFYFNEKELTDVSKSQEESCQEDAVPYGRVQNGPDF